MFSYSFLYLFRRGWMGRVLPCFGFRGPDTEHEGGAKVGNLEDAVCRDEDVRPLDIPVHYARG